MRKFFSALVIVPLAIVFVVFAVANRHLVTVSFNPFNSSDPAVGATLPLFVVIILSAILGVIAGGVATWFRQGHWRRAARQREADLRAHAAVASRNGTQRLPAPGSPYMAGERDKSGATL